MIFNGKETLICKQKSLIYLYMIFNILSMITDNLWRETLLEYKHTIILNILLEYKMILFYNNYI